MNNKDLKNILNVHSIESFGTHDGPGLRLVIFLQGCNLKCLYCQNPDTIEYSGGKPYQNIELVERAKRMIGYFNDGGGVTVSGGEPLLQGASVVNLFTLLKNEGIHTNIDTNGTINTAYSKKLIADLADLVMFDVKSVTENGFEKMTGHHGLNILMENINLRERMKKEFWLRYVLVPGYTDSRNSLMWLVDTFKSYEYLTCLEILPYHQLGKYKWKNLGWEYPLEGVSENSQDKLDEVKDLLAPHFAHLKIK